MAFWTASMDDVERHFEVGGSCRDVDEFEKLNRIGEGTYGTVYRARDRKTNQIVALKRVILHNESSEGFPITALREIKLLQRLRHPNCVGLREVVVGRKRSSVFLVFEYCEHDLALLRSIKRHVFTESELKCIMLSILTALDYLHQNSILHRCVGLCLACVRWNNPDGLYASDIKMSNVLYDRYGHVKLADFGLARETSRCREEMTPKVVTLSYRAPEILLGMADYTSAVDLWSCGVLFVELLLDEPFLRGKNELEQMEQIMELLGPINEQNFPGSSSARNANTFLLHTRRKYTLESVLDKVSDRGIDLLYGLLTYDPSKRLTAKQAMHHPYFREKPFPTDSSMMPTFPSLHSSSSTGTSSTSRSHRQHPSHHAVKSGAHSAATGSSTAGVAAGITGATAGAMDFRFGSCF